MYRDLMRGYDGPPSVLADQAHDWVTRDPVRWRNPDVYDPADVLAVYGMIALTSALRRPAGWSGEAVHGPDDLVETILRCRLVAASSRGVNTALNDDGSVTIWAAHTASKLWTGQVTVDKIWHSCTRVLESMAARSPRDDEGLRIPPPIDAADETEGIMATGYDRRAVNAPIEDGFSMSAHQSGRFRLVGGRPGIELYSLIGAAIMEDMGRWGHKTDPQIPALTDRPLRDHFDLREWSLTAPSMCVEYRLAGYRGYLAGP